MDEDLIVTQMGLIFSQTRYIRMALDSLERSASRYAGVALGVAAAGPHQWGAPPLEAGALRVFVVNIADLIPEEGGLLGFLSSTFRLFSSMVGGLVGGVISGIALPVILGELIAVTVNVRDILRMLGFTGQPDQQQAGAPESSGTTISFLNRLEHTADTLANILGLANAQQASGTPPASAESRTWLQTLQTVSRVVDGLILLVPNLIGAFASFLMRIDQLKVGILDMLEFLMRNVLVLRGLVLLTIYDTIASAARLAGQILNLISTAASSLLGALFRMLESVLVGVLDTIGYLSAAVTDMVNALLPWLVRTVFNLLDALSQMPIFRLMFAFVEVLPVVLPHILSILHETVTPSEQADLTAARNRMIAGLAAAATPAPMPEPMPDFANQPLVQTALGAAAESVMDVAGNIQRGTTSMLNTTTGLMTDIASNMTAAIGPNGEGLTGNITALAQPVIQNAEDVTRQLREASEAAAATSNPELNTIATAYETWLTEGHGLDTILSDITTYFEHAPAVSGSMMDQVATAATPPAAATHRRDRRSHRADHRRRARGCASAWIRRPIASHKQRFRPRFGTGRG